MLKMPFFFIEQKASFKNCNGEEKEPVTSVEDQKIYCENIDKFLWDI